MTSWLTYALLPWLRESWWLWFLIPTVLVLLTLRRRVMDGPVARVRLRIATWMTGFRKAVANTVTPFAVIAAELRRMNDLKETEMGERLNPKTGEKDPIFIIKEVPKPDDTQVFWGEDEEPTGIAGLRARLARKWDSVPGEDE